MSYRKLTPYLILSYVILLLILSLSTSNAKADAIETIQDNLNMAIADIIMIVVSCGIIVISAFDARIAVMCAFLIYASIFILFTLITEEGMTGFNPYFSGVAMMLCFVVLCLGLLVTYKKGNTPINVV